MALEFSNDQDAELESLILYLHKKYGYDFRGYARASLLRRMLKTVEEQSLNGINGIAGWLERDEENFGILLKTVTVNVTSLFRDPDFFHLLRDKVIPVLATYPVIKIWCAGCSSGEEAYSIAILLHEAGLLNRTRIYGTDVNPFNIEKAQKGIIPLQQMKDYITAYHEAGGRRDCADYYSVAYDHALIDKAIRQNIVFSQHNLVTDKVFNEFQLICCRNVLIYFNRQLQDRVLKLFYESLVHRGLLALGAKESIMFTDIRDRFESFGAPMQRVFRKMK